MKRINGNLATAAAIAAAAIILAAGCATLGGRYNARADQAGFVTVKDGQFILNGQPFKFAGANNYYMHYESDRMQADLLDAAVGMGFKVLRIWGFMNGNNPEHKVYGMIAPALDGKPARYGIPAGEAVPAGAKDAFERLDFTIAEAGKRGIKLVIALNNYWADFGGIQQATTWQRWFGLAKPTDFYTDAGAKAAYKEFVRFLLTRTNAYTGVPYNEDPTVMTWELMNEPRNPDDKTGRTVTLWSAEMSAYVKKLAPLQLCAVGDEGFFARPSVLGWLEEGNHAYNGSEGIDFDALIALPNIDYGTYHLYPEGWGIAPDLVEGWGVQYIKDHSAAGIAAGKPTVLEEYGIGAAGGQNRLAVYDSWNRAVLESGGNGTMVWILTASNDKELAENPPGDGVYDDYDGYRVMNDADPVSESLRTWARRFAGEDIPEAAAVLLLSPAKARDVKGFYRVRARIVPAGKTVKEARLWIDGVAGNLLQYNKDQDVYRYNLDTAPLVDGQAYLVKAVVEFTDGGIMETAAVPITVANRIRYTELRRLDFAAPYAAVQSMGAYQASLKKVGHTALNGGMIEVQADFPGVNEWEELKVKFSPLPEAAQAAKVEFTMYLAKALAVPSADKSKPENNLPGTQPYVAFDPGWVKTGIHANNIKFGDLAVVRLDDGQEYFKQTVSLEFFQNTQYASLVICPTLGFVKYSGPVYIDDVILYKKD